MRTGFEKLNTANARLPDPVMLADLEPVRRGLFERRGRPRDESLAVCDEPLMLRCAIGAQLPLDRGFDPLFRRSDRHDRSIITRPLSNIASPPHMELPSF